MGDYKCTFTMANSDEKNQSAKNLLSRSLIAFNKNKHEIKKVNSSHACIKIYDVCWFKIVIGSSALFSTYPHLRKTFWHSQIGTFSCVLKNNKVCDKYDGTSGIVIWVTICPRARQYLMSWSGYAGYVLGCACHTSRSSWTSNYCLLLAFNFSIKSTYSTHSS